MVCGYNGSMDSVKIKEVQEHLSDRSYYEVKQLLNGEVESKDKLSLEYILYDLLYKETRLKEHKSSRDETFGRLEGELGKGEAYYAIYDVLYENFENYLITDEYKDSFFLKGSKISSNSRINSDREWNRLVKNGTDVEVYEYIKENSSEFLENEIVRFLCRYTYKCSTLAKELFLKLIDTFNVDELDFYYYFSLKSGLLDDLKRYDELYEFLHNNYDRHKNKDVVNSLLIDVCVELKRYKEALEYCSKIEIEECKFKFSLFEAYKELGMKKEVKRFIFEYYKNSWFNTYSTEDETIINYLIREKKYECANKIIDKYLQKNVNSSGNIVSYLYFKLGMILLKQKEYKEALRKFMFSYKWFDKSKVVKFKCSLEKIYFKIALCNYGLYYKDNIKKFDIDKFVSGKNKTMFDYSFLDTYSLSFKNYKKYIDLAKIESNYDSRYVNRNKQLDVKVQEDINQIILSIAKHKDVSNEDLKHCRYYLFKHYADRDSDEFRKIADSLVQKWQGEGDSYNKMYELAGLNHSLKNYEDAKKYYERAIEIGKKYSIDLAEIYINMQNLAKNIENNKTKLLKLSTSYFIKSQKEYVKNSNRNLNKKFNNRRNYEEYKHNGANIREVYKYRKFGMQTIDSLMNSYIYFSKHRQLNDPYDLRVGRLREILSKNISAIDRKVEDYYSVFCASSVNNNNLMWSHYADSHRGICVKYNFSNNFCIPEDTFYKEIIYRPENYVEEDKTYIDDYFFTKSGNWSYEQEIRFLKFNKRDSESKVSYSSDITIAKSNNMFCVTIDEIIVGSEFEDSNKKLLLSVKEQIEKSQGSKVELKRAVLGKDRAWKLDIEDYSLDNL